MDPNKDTTGVWQAFAPYFGVIIARHGFELVEKCPKNPTGFPHAYVTFANPEMVIRFTEEGAGSRSVEVSSASSRVPFMLSGLLDELDGAKLETRERDCHVLAGRFETDYDSIKRLLEPSNLSELSESMERRAVNTYRTR